MFCAWALVVEVFEVVVCSRAALQMTKVMIEMGACIELEVASSVQIGLFLFPHWREQYTPALCMPIVM